MIYVSKKQLSQVEYLIEQSLKGHHVLFDADTVKRAFRKKLPKSQNPGQVESHIEELILKPTLIQKRAFIESLPQVSLYLLIRTYFNIIENNLIHATELMH